MIPELRVAIEHWPFVTVPTELLFDARVPRPAKMTYGYLQVWGRADGKVFVSREKLARAAGVSRSTLYEHLQALELAGWVHRYHDGKRDVILVRKRSGQSDESGQPDSSVRLSGLNPSGQSDTEVEALKEKKKETSSAAPRARTGKLTKAELADFDRFWSLVPKKASKGGAKRAWRGALQRAGGLEVLLAGMEAYAAKVEREGTEGSKIKHPSGWLRDDRWDDQPDPQFKGPPVAAGNPPESNRERQARKRSEAEAEAEGADPEFASMAARLSAKFRGSP